jgi:LPXTG-motif cell wall-anchored protein
MLQRCVLRESASNLIIENRHVNKPCEIFPTGLSEDFNNDPVNHIGQFAEPGTGPASVTHFMLAMALLGILLLWLLNRRKNLILS